MGELGFGRPARFFKGLGPFFFGWILFFFREKPFLVWDFGSGSRARELCRFLVFGHMAILKGRLRDCNLYGRAHRSFGVGL